MNPEWHPQAPGFAVQKATRTRETPRQGFKDASSIFSSALRSCLVRSLQSWAWIVMLATFRAKPWLTPGAAGQKGMSRKKTPRQQRGFQWKCCRSWLWGHTTQKPFLKQGWEEALGEEKKSLLGGFPTRHRCHWNSCFLFNIDCSQWGGKLHRKPLRSSQAEIKAPL